MAFEFRPHRGHLADAMAEKRTFENWDDLLMFLRDDWSEWYATVSDVKAEPYGYDDRIEWDTYIITGAIHYTVRGEPKTERAVFGFINGNPIAPCPHTLWSGGSADAFCLGCMKTRSEIAQGVQGE